MLLFGEGTKKLYTGTFHNEPPADEGKFEMRTESVLYEMNKMIEDSN